MTKTAWCTGALLAAIACSNGGGGTGMPGVFEPALLGAQPAPRAPDGGVGASTFSVFVGAHDGQGIYALPAPEDFDVTCAQGDCAVVSARQVGGGTEGVLAIVVDDSASNTSMPSVCTGCPTDPQGLRAVAVKRLAQVLLDRAPKWRIALFDFGPTSINTFRTTRLLAGYTSRIEDLEAGADALHAGGGTFLYDALLAVPTTVAGERHFLGDGGAPAHVLVVSDGEDTHSSATLAQGIDAGLKARVPFDAVGYGEVDGGSTPYLAAKAYNDLRRCSGATGGFVTLVSRDRLPELFEQIAEVYVAGYVELIVALPAGAGPVTGSVGLKGTSTRAEFDFP